MTHLPLTPIEIKRGADLQEQIEALNVEMAGILGASLNAHDSVCASLPEISVRRRIRTTRIKRLEEALAGKSAERNMILHLAGLSPGR